MTSELSEKAWGELTGMDFVIDPRPDAEAPAVFRKDGQTVGDRVTLEGQEWLLSILAINGAGKTGWVKSLYWAKVEGILWPVLSNADKIVVFIFPVPRPRRTAICWAGSPMTIL